MNFFVKTAHCLDFIANGAAIRVADHVFGGLRWRINDTETFVDVSGVIARLFVQSIAQRRTDTVGIVNHEFHLV